MAHVVGVFQNMAREDSDHGIFGANVAGGHEYSNAGDSGGGSGFATDTVATNDCFRVRELLLGDGDDLAMRFEDGAEGFSPRNGGPNFDRCGKGLWVRDGF